MKKAPSVILLVFLAIASFLVGSWYTQWKAGNHPASGGRRILYYQDPMHPAYKSHKPGIAPDCGMQLEPVYADREPATTDTRDGSAPLPRGTVQISPEKQQVIGVRVGPAEKTHRTHTLRMLGRVTVDETKIYRLNAAVDGWIREIFPNSVGSLVQKDQPLVAFYSPEFLAPEQAYLYALGAMDRYLESGKEPPVQIALTRANVQQAVDSLRNLGMGDIQIEEIKRTRQLTQNIMLRAPTTGFVLARNVSPGQRFERGTELYRIVELSQVWILADLFESEGRFLHPGQSARIHYQGNWFRARMSDVLPQFDPATRTLKARFETDNPSYTLRPEMFVDVELPVSFPPTITVPADAVLDSGLKKTVFVDRGNGFFEPRAVQTGWRLGDQVQITKGLQPGEQIVVSGTFLLDSESRMQLAAAGTPTTATQKDPVCGMDVDPAQAPVRKSSHRHQTYYFCSDHCRKVFDKNPEHYLAKNR